MKKWLDWQSETSSKHAEASRDVRARPPGWLVANGLVGPVAGALSNFKRSNGHCIGAQSTFLTNDEQTKSEKSYQRIPNSTLKSLQHERNRSYASWPMWQPNRS